MTLEIAPIGLFESNKDYLLSLCKCGECPLAQDGRPVLPVLGSGPEHARLVLVGEAPGRNEVKNGTPFVGAAGKLLNQTLAAVEIERESVYITNTVLCRPPPNEKGDVAPPAAAIKACRDRLLEEIRQREPDIVIGLGATAAKSLLPGIGASGLSDLIGLTHWVPALEAYVTPTYHPAAVLHGQTDLFDDILDTFKRVGRYLQGKSPFPPRTLPEIPFKWARPGEYLEAFRILRTFYEAEDCVIALDTETDGFDPLGDDLLEVQLANLETVAVLEAEVFSHPQVRKLFIDMLQDKHFIWILHNEQFDFKFLYHNFGVVPAQSIDTMAMALAISERGVTVGLKRLSRTWLGAPYYEDLVKQYLKKENKMSAVPREILASYAAADVYYTRRLVDILTPMVEEEGMTKLVAEIFEPAQRMFAQLSYDGVTIDTDYAQTVEEAWQPEIDNAVLRLRSLAAEVGFDPRDVLKGGRDLKPVSFNPRSVKQIQGLIYDTLWDRIGGYNIPGAYRAHGTALTERTTGIDFLDANAGKPAIDDLRILRMYDKFLRSYVQGILDDVRRDGRVHPDFKLFGTVTGRITINNPPLQTITHPRIETKVGDTTVGALGWQIRRMFVPSRVVVRDWLGRGYYIPKLLYEVDYKQLELRIAWHYCKDAEFGDAIMSGDFHRRTAAKIFHKDILDRDGLEAAEAAVSSWERFIAKYVVFGLLYGRQAASLSEGELQTDMATAQEWVNNFWRSYPGLKKWMDAVKAFAYREGYVKTTLGRKRRWSLITPETKQPMGNQAMNAPIQSLAADLCLSSAIKVNNLLRELGWGRVLYTVHDSIVLETWYGRLDEVETLLQEVMCTPPFKTCAVFDIDINVGPSWAEVQDLEKFRKGQRAKMPEVVEGSVAPQTRTQLLGNKKRR